MASAPTPQPASQVTPTQIPSSQRVSQMAPPAQITPSQRASQMAPLTQTSPSQRVSQVAPQAQVPIPQRASQVVPPDVSSSQGASQSSVSRRPSQMPPSQETPQPNPSRRPSQTSPPRRPSQVPSSQRASQVVPSQATPSNTMELTPPQVQAQGNVSRSRRSSAVGAPQGSSPQEQLGPSQRASQVLPPQVPLTNRASQLAPPQAQTSSPQEQLGPSPRASQVLPPQVPIPTRASQLAPPQGLPQQGTPALRASQVLPSQGTLSQSSVPLTLPSQRVSQVPSPQSSIPLTLPLQANPPQDFPLQSIPSQLLPPIPETLPLQPSSQQFLPPSPLLPPAMSTQLLSPLSAIQTSLEAVQAAHIPTENIAQNRAAPYCEKPDTKIMRRISLEMRHRMFLMGMRITYDEGGPIGCNFFVMGEIGKTFIVKLRQYPCCQCGEFLLQRLCKHMMFISLRVFRLEQSDHRIWQRALLSSELSALLAHPLITPPVKPPFRSKLRKPLPPEPPKPETPICCPVCFDEIQFFDNEVKKPLGSKRVHVPKSKLDMGTQRKKEDKAKVEEALAEPWVERLKKFEPLLHCPTPNCQAEGCMKIVHRMCYLKWNRFKKMSYDLPHILTPNNFYPCAFKCH